VATIIDDAVSAPAETAAKEAAWYDTPVDQLAGMMPEAVKGAGFALNGKNRPLDNPDEIFDRSFKATKALRAATYKGYNHPDEVTKSLNPAFSSQFGMFMASGTPGFGNNGLGNLVEQINSAFKQTEALKNFTLTSPLSSGFVPFDLVAPSRLIYPVYSPLRNKIPRVPGQGTSRRVKVTTGISGSQTGGQGVVDISIPELISGTSITGTWPLNLPGAGAQTAVDLNVPYQFFGLTEALSWLAQFAGQGFEDISALANLILLQEFMLAEEYAMISATPVNLAAPGSPTLTARTAGSNETAITYASGVCVCVTAVNYYGETTASTVIHASGTTSTTTVVDVTIAPVAGAQQYNIYVTDASAAGLASATHLYVGTSVQAGVSYAGTQQAGSVGGLKFTLQGNIESLTTVAPPASDTGTGKSTRMAGLIPTLSGQAATAGVYPTSPVTWEGGYLNQKLGTHLSITAVNNTLQALFDGTGSNSPGSFRADPAELIGEGGDLMRMSNDIVQSGAATNYRLNIDQAQLAGVRTGAAVSEFQNPITRSIVQLLVHPWLTQGTAMLMSYTLPFTWSNVANCWEMVMVQDYLSISWPVIDATFRYSLFQYGALVSQAPQYSALLQGIQQSDTTPYS
jgi:hypothetical protein